jgi:hypothetical protein
MPGGVSFSTKTRPMQRSTVSIVRLRARMGYIIEEYYSEYSSGRI